MVKIILLRNNTFKEMNGMKYLLVALITITLLGCGGAEERKSVYLKKAKISLEKGEFDKARIELKNVLQIDPKDAQAHFQLAEIYDQKKEYQKAFRKFSKVIELDPDNLEAQARIGTYLLLLAGDTDKAIEKRDIILSRDNNNTSGLLLKAAILYRQNDVAGAKEITQEIFSSEPGFVRNAVFLSTLYMKDKKYEDAIDVLNACIKENPNDYSLVNILANVYLRIGEHDLAENAYMKILEKDPGVYANYLKLALFYKETGNFDKAENILRTAIDKNDEDVNRVVALIDIIQQAKGNQAAIAELKKFVSKKSDMGELRLSLAKLYMEETEHDEAEKVFIAAVSDFPDDLIGIKSRVYLASMYMKNRRIEDATDIIDDALKISPNDSEVNFIKAKLLLERKDYEGAIVTLRAVLKENPENVEAYLMLSLAHKESGEIGLADEVITQAHENNRANAKGLMQLARYHARNKSNQRLERVVDDYLSIDANNYEAMSFKSMLLNERKVFSEAFEYASRMVELYPTMPNGYIQSVPHLLAESRSNEAVVLLDDGYKKVTDKGGILEPLVSLHATQKNYDVAVTKIQTAIRENGDVADLYMLLAKVQVASGNVADARLSLNKSGAKNDLEQSFGVAQIYEGLGDYENAINEYEKAYVKYADNIVLINNLATLLVEHRKDDKSMMRAKELADKLMGLDQSIILDTVGWVYYKTGNYSEAAGILKSAVEKSPNEPVFNYHLGMALYGIGDKSASKVYLTRSLATNSNFHGREDAEVILEKLQ